MSVLNHPLWAELREYVRLERREDTTWGCHRTEIDKSIPPELLARAMAATMECVACGAEGISFIRARKRSGQERPPKHLHAYYAGTCPTAMRHGCCRGDKAQEEKQLIWEDLQQL